ncbi:serine/threonine protein kinase [Planomonospora sp. ID67723]|uniref:serine/threonine-protein kinase n=1 Tax=Planomonospora sp. ID67723 TaxID=2738134 RepID=UPI0018C3FB20|nr:serine/threonine-protein kinase [Planomonospora sp. ID67723]MBG0831969.1 serine/threonine protein kinase [Planomonospora sp. ID67723]
MSDLGRLEPRDPQWIGVYQLVGVLGEGGQGTVYLGHDPSGRRVAVKVLHARMAAEDAVRERFEREAALARRVAAFCTAQVLEAGISDGRLYLVSEYVPGPSLQHLVTAEGPRAGGGLERLAVATATALAAIHRTGIVHRDFKPANVIMGPEGPVVIDFGIARAVETSTTRSALVGSPGYMAPEQLSGRPAGPASDIFAWAATMAYAATGRPAFAGQHPAAVMTAVLTREPDLTGVPEALRPLLASCLAKDPAVRPDAAQVLATLTSGGATVANGGNGLQPAEWTAPAPMVAGRRTGVAESPRHHGGARSLYAAGLVFGTAQVAVIYGGAFGDLSETALLKLAPLWISSLAFGGSGLLMPRPTPIKAGVAAVAVVLLAVVLYGLLWPLL